MTHAQLVAFLRFMHAEAARGWLVNDLHRHGVAHAAFPLLAWAMRWHEIVRRDGTLSIARSYRPAEWPPILAEAGIERARVFRAFRSEEHTSQLQSLMRNSYAVFCLKKN